MAAGAGCGASDRRSEDAEELEEEECAGDDMAARCAGKGESGS